jgi:AcrR family transcriptional regulator
MCDTGGMATTAKGVRERARAELVDAIKQAARRQLAAGGASGLSLRAIARELEMASSAIYRYFPSRDDLLTALIIDAYDAVGEVAEATDARHAQEPPRLRWAAVCRAVRAWARANLQEYALVYGSPVPGYRAPADTVAHAGRVADVLAGLVRDGVASASSAGTPLPSARESEVDVDSALHDVALRGLMPGVTPDVVTRSLMAWTELFGLISFELFGHLVGSITDDDAFFDRAIDLMWCFVGVDAAPVRVADA